MTEPRKAPFFRPPETRAEETLDQFWDGDLDWQRSVRTYPIPALAVAALGGFFLGRRYGMQLFSDLSAFAGQEVLRVLESTLDSTPEGPQNRGASASSL